MGEDKSLMYKLPSNSYSFIVRKNILIPMVDTHMHIQSNDIAPLPIMKGLINKTLCGSYKNMKEIDFLDGLTIDELKSNKMFPGGGFFGNEIDFGSTSFLTRTVARWPVTWAVKDYGKITRENSFHNAGIYMNDLLKTNMGIESFLNYILIDNTKTSYKKRRRLIVARAKTIDEFMLTAGFYYNKDEFFTGGFEFSVLLCMELHYAHYWGAYGIPIYIEYNGKVYYISNTLNYYNKSNNSSEETILRLNNAYDIPEAVLKDVYVIEKPNSFNTDRRDANLRNISINNLKNIESFKINNVNTQSEKYKHFLKELKETEIDQYEYYDKHLEYIRMATLKYPLRYLPFYHFDPRRFFSTPDDILKKHEFYIQKNYTNNLIKVNINEIIDTLKVGEQFKNNFNEQELWNNEILETSDTGLFWGIKMYLALGYPPYLYSEKHLKKVFPNLEISMYKNLLGFYEKCAKNKIPIICHGSPLGMTIADAGVYLKQYLKMRKWDSKIDFSVGRKRFLMGLGLIDSFSSPKSWKIVLNDLGSLGNDFKLCFAHFGGLKQFNEESKKSYHWRAEICELIQKYKNIYTDISCYTFSENLPVEFSETEIIIERNWQTKVDKFFTKISAEKYIRKSININNMSSEVKKEYSEVVLYLVRRSKKKAHRDLVMTAVNLKNIIKKYPKLQYRILFGTDWPMSEMTTKGIPNYNSTIFILLQLVTLEMGNEWDAWHQFVVLNPLNFLGLLRDGDSINNDEYEIDFSKIDKMKNNLINRIKVLFNVDKEDKNLNDEIKEKYTLDRDVLLGGKEKEGSIENLYDKLERFKTEKIKSAKKMITVNRKLRLTDFGDV